jgi:hypothetical protein
MLPKHLHVPDCDAAKVFIGAERFELMVIDATDDGNKDEPLTVEPNPNESLPVDLLAIIKEPTPPALIFDANNKAKSRISVVVANAAALILGAPVAPSTMAIGFS